MQSFHRFERSTLLFIGLLMVSFMLTTLDVRGQQAGIGEVLRDGAQTLFSPLQKAVSAVTRPVVGLFDGISNLAGLRDENDRLRQRIAELEGAAQETETLQNQLDALLLAQGLELPGEFTSITARIFSNGASDFDRVRFLDKGSDDGVVKGQAVIDVNTGGLVGRIDLVSQHSARVRLITDLQMGVGVRNLNTNETGWVAGQGTDPLQLEMFSAVKPVSEGDLLVTDGSRFPPEISVGRILEPAESEAGFGTFSTVAPTIDLGRLDFVEVVVGWSPLDAVLGGPGDDVVPNPSVGRE